jgi:hypothetical protein
MMTDTLHPLAPHDLPRYLAGPDGDPLFTAVLWLLIIMVLALLALFTHNNIFWVAALLLSAIRLPDFTTPLKSIARSLETLAATRAGGDATREQTTAGDTPPVADSPAKENE